ncbi:hypothetical protein CFC21_021498 [Triticum aestivum]|uniref:Uncharacterized protein n=2 Tax=Triticum aestivum TaxID=4565 RepID=A0A9R1EA10_WHEAT|nr:hypothetical protein CFC21_021498 [Triticum aestivum]
MGNCQAADAAAVVIQHPGDAKVERLHWPTTAADVMRRNPGTTSPSSSSTTNLAALTTPSPEKEEVTKAVQMRKQERMRVCDEAIEQQRPRLHRRRQLPRPRGEDAAAAPSGEQRQPADHQERKRLEKDRHHRSITAAPGRGRGRGGHWRPALQSITESSSSGHTECEDTPWPGEPDSIEPV